MPKSLQSLPPEERQRLEALYSYSILDTPRESEFDALTQLAAAMCGTPMAFVSLVDHNRLWFKSSVGVPEGINNVPRENSFCQNAIESDQLFEIPDLTQNHISKDQAIVTGAPHLRYYAGAPLVDKNGIRLGTLCVMHLQPHQLNVQQKTLLKMLASFAMTLIELHRTKTQLQKSESLYHNMIENAGDIIYLSNSAGLFTFVNKRAERMTGFSTEELIGKPYLYLIPEEWQEKVVKFYEKQRDERLPETTFEFPVRTKSGGWKWVEQTVVAVMDNDEITGYHCVVRDMDQRKEIEKQIIAAKEQAEQTARAKELFLANMSHEIRTPMNAVLGFTDLLKKTHLNEEQSEFVDAISTSGRNLMTIINDILDYSKIEAGMMTLERTNLGIRSTMSSLAVLFEKRAQEKNIRLGFTVDPQIPEIVIGDPTRLTQIITNLVGNALKFTSRGYIDVIVRKLEEKDSNVRVQFNVCDTGIGIPQDKLEQIFERFSQATESTTRKYGGTGLGLSIVKSLVELQGGTISVCSEPGEGSVFSFVLPYEVATEELLEETDPAAEAEQQLNPMHVLLVEDNTINQKLAERVLRDFGFTVDIAGNGLIALQKLKAQPGAYDLILMDMQMPEMDGYTAATEIRQTLGLLTPIFAMTAHAMSGEKEKCLQLGMNDYISKPFSAKDLRTRIRHHFYSGTTEHRQPQIRTINNSPVIDLSYLTQLSGGSNAFVAELLGIFLQEIPKELELVRVGIQQEDYNIIRAISHKMKSSMQLVGLEQQLNPVLGLIEQLAGAQNGIANIRETFAIVDNICRLALDEIRSILPRYAEPLAS